MLFWKIAYYLNSHSRAIEIDAIVVKNICLSKFRRKVCKIKVKKRKLMYYYLIITIIIEYAWISLSVPK